MKKPFSKLQYVSISVLLLSTGYFGVYTYHPLPKFETHMIAILAGLALSLVLYIAGWVYSSLTEKSRALSLWIPAAICMLGYMLLFPIFIAMGILLFYPMTYLVKVLLKEKKPSGRQSP